MKKTPQCNLITLFLSLITFLSINPVVVAQLSFEFTPFVIPDSGLPRGTVLHGINNAGMLCGTWGTHGVSDLRGFVQSRGLVTDVTFPGAGGNPNNFPYGVDVLGNLTGINDQGTAIGVYTDEQAHLRSFLRNSSGEITLIPDAIPQSGFNEMWSINNRGTIVGAAAEITTDFLSFVSTLHGFVLEDGEYTQIDFPGAVGTVANGINDHNQIVGWYFDEEFNGDGFLLDKAGFSIVAVPGAVWTSATAINNRGQVIGFYGDEIGNMHGFLLQQGVYTTIDIPGESSTSLWAINDRGQIVGFNDLNPERSYIITIGK